MPEGKDDEFFSYLPEKPIDDYAIKFTRAEPAQHIGDSCASYFWTPYPDDVQPYGFNPAIPETMREALGEQCKIIVLLKNPVERTLSAYLHHIAHGSLACDTEILNAPLNLGLIALSRYGHHLQQWLKVFNSGQVLVLPAPKRNNAEAVLARASRFLALPTTHNFNNSKEAVFAGIRRQRREDGVWVAIGQRGIESLELIQRPLPITVSDQQTWVRLVHQREIEQISHQLLADTHLLAEMINSNQHWHDAEFERWPNWPRSHL